MKHVVKFRRSLCYGPYVYAFVKHVRALSNLAPLEELFPPNVQHRSYAPKTKRTKAKKNVLGASSSGSGTNETGLVEYFTQFFKMCKASHNRIHKVHQIQKKHMREFCADLSARGYHHVPHNGPDLADSDCEEFHMPPLTPEDFQGWTGFPSTFATGQEDDDEGSENSSAQ